jgi:hypothetical protein
MARLIVVLAACCGCDIGISGDNDCPTATPNGEEGVLYMEGDGYVNDGLYQHITIPGYIPTHDFTLTGRSIVFDPPVCEKDDRGVVIVKDSIPQCKVNVHVEPTTTDCRFDDVVYDFVGATIEAKGRGDHVVLASDITAEEAHVQIKCDVDLVGKDNDTTITIRGSNGKVRYQDRIELICQRADKFKVFWDEVVGRTIPETLEGTVHVGEEFFVRYLMTKTEQSLQTDGPPLLGNGMVPVGPDPAFEVVGYEAYPLMAIRMRLKALKPATRPMITAGRLTAAVPVVIIP